MGKELLKIALIDDTTKPQALNCYSNVFPGLRKLINKRDEIIINNW